MAGGTLTTEKTGLARRLTPLPEAHIENIDWSKCGDIERTPGKVSGSWLVKNTRLPVWAILENADDHTPDEIANDLFEGVTAEIVQRIITFAKSHAPASVPTIMGHLPPGSLAVSSFIPMLQASINADTGAAMNDGRGGTRPVSPALTGRPRRRIITANDKPHPDVTDRAAEPGGVEP